MKIESLKLNGVLRFGVPIELDFSALPPGLIAVVGANGEGKSTLLEAMIAGFYREFPSRGPAIDYATEKNSYIDVRAALESRTLRARLSMDGVQRASDAILCDESGAGVLNDGKVTTFDQAVARELPPLAQLLASSFSAQNRRGTFSTLDKKGRRDLFASLLGLAQLEAHAATSRQAALMVERRLGELQALIDRLAAETTETQQAALDAERRDLIARGVDVVRRLTDVVAHVGMFERKRTEMSAAAAAYQRAQTALADAQREQRDLTAQLRAIETEDVELARSLERRRFEVDATVTRTIDRENAILAALPTQAAVDATLAETLARIDRQLAADRADRTARIANNEALVARGHDIRAAVRTHADLKAQLHTVDHELATRGAHEGDGRRALNLLALEQATLAGAERELRGVRATTAVLERVPCGGKAPYDGCELLQAARTADTRRPDLEAQVARHTALTTEIADLMADVDRREALVLQAKATREQIVAAITPALVATAELISKLEAAETRIAELRAEFDVLDARAKAARQAAAEVATAADQKFQQQTADRATAIDLARRLATDAIATIEAERARSESALRARRAPVDQALERVGGAVLVAEASLREHAAAHDALATIEAELTAARQRHAIETADAARLEAEQQAFTRRQDDFSRRLAERITLVEAAQTLETDLVEWQALARIFGPDGLPVLEIDAAGPGVSALANDLLHACFGSRFTVELVTQEPKTKGGGFKEVFELKVFDGERGGEARDLTDLSGGEQVIIDESLRSAIAVFVNRRNVQPIRTIWRDETVGALDPDNALRYMAMLRRLHALSGAHHCFFVSHNSAASDLADAQIVVADGTARIMLPPFRSAA